jgi:hypothetical protein
MSDRRPSVKMLCSVGPTTCAKAQPIQRPSTIHEGGAPRRRMPNLFRETEPTSVPRGHEAAHQYPPSVCRGLRCAEWPAFRSGSLRKRAEFDEPLPRMVGALSVYEGLSNCGA